MKYLMDLTIKEIFVPMRLVNDLWPLSFRIKLLTVPKSSNILHRIFASQSIIRDIRHHRLAILQSTTLHNPACNRTLEMVVVRLDSEVCERNLIWSSLDE